MRSLSSLSLRLLPLALCLGLSAGGATAQHVRTLAVTGHEVFGVGTITDIVKMSVNDKGDWLVLVDTNGPGASDFVLLRNGIPTLQEGDSLSSPEGATVSSMDLPSINIWGDIGWNLNIAGVPVAGNSGAYFNSKIVIQEGRVSTAPEFTLGTPWMLIFNVRLNNSNQMLVHGTVDDPLIASAGDQALVFVTLDEEGNLVSENVYMKEGDVVGPGLMPIQLFGTATHSVAFNNRGDIMAFVDTSASSSTDGFIFLNYQQIAREGDDSPVEGRTWSSLASPELDVNDYGEYVFSGTISGDTQTNSLIIKNGDKYKQQGDVIPTMAPRKIHSFFSAPIFITNAGGVFWFCKTDENDSAKDSGIFLNERMLVQEGITPVDGTFVRILETLTESFTVPPDGRYLVFWAQLDDSRTGAFLIDVGVVTRLPGCAENTGWLGHRSGLPLLGERMAFEMDDGQGTGVLPILFMSTMPIAGYPPCGIETYAGELLIDLSPANGNPALFQLGVPWGGAPVVQYVDIPDDPILADAVVYAQGLFWDAGDQLPEQNLLLTNALRIEFATP